MSSPLISVVMPVYNNSTTVGAAIHSMLRQTVRDIELIVIDDRSNDESYSVVEAIRDPRIRLFRNERNRGSAATRNRGLDLMRGTFMAPMDGDDVCPPDRLELTLAALQANPALIVCGGWYRQESRRSRSYVARLPCGPAAVRAYLLYGAPFAHGALLFRWAMCKENGIRYPEESGAADDYGFYYQCAQCAEIDNIPKVLQTHRHNPRGITATVGDRWTEYRLEGIREELAKLFPEGVNEANLRFHAAVGNGTGAMDLASLARSRTWLETIVEANRQKRIYDIEGMAKATAMVWFRVCRNSAHLGLSAWRAWRTSPWTAHDNPTRPELVSFFGTWALARLFPRRRRPQGALTGL